MAVTLDKYSIALSGDDAIATAEVVVTDELGKEIGRKAISASVNAALRADDPKVREALGKSVRPDARDVLKAKLLAEAQVAADAVKSAGDPLQHFDGLGGELASEVSKFSNEPKGETEVGG